MNQPVMCPLAIGSTCSLKSVDKIVIDHEQGGKLNDKHTQMAQCQ